MSVLNIPEQGIPMEPTDFVVRFVGPAGEGIIVLGDIFVKSCVRSGLGAFTFRSYPTEVRGGSVMYQVRIATDRVLNQGDRPDILVAFNRKEMEKHHTSLNEHGVLLVDSSAAPIAQGPFDTIQVPLDELTKEFGAARRNMAVLGTLVHYLGLEDSLVRSLIQERFKEREEVLRKDIGAYSSGLEYCKSRGWRSSKTLEPVRQPARMLLLSGNEAISLGAIAAGCRFFAGYPITPASEILEYLAEVLPRFNGSVLQVEDEMAALASVIGASFAGTKAMTATSGPGFSLMGELIGYASMAEIPCVIVDAQRVGPSTGIPTNTEQSDLLLAIHASHGESPRIVLAPSTVEECYRLTVEAFNLAESLQLPVILLSDLALSHRMEAIPRPDTNQLKIVDRMTPAGIVNEGYKRFQITEDNVSPMAIPGSGWLYPAMGIEHDESGYPSYTPETRTKMTRKRFGKLSHVDPDRFVRTFGDPTAPTGVIGWGSTEGAIHEAVSRLARDGLPVQGLQLKMLWPLPLDAITRFLEGKKKVAVAEINHTGQCARLLRTELGLVAEGIRKYIGLPFTPSELAVELREVARRG